MEQGALKAVTSGIAAADLNHRWDGEIGSRSKAAYASVPGIKDNQQGLCLSGWLFTYVSVSSLQAQSGGWKNII